MRSPSATMQVPGYAKPVADDKTREPQDEPPRGSAPLGPRARRQTVAANSKPPLTIVGVRAVALSFSALAAAPLCWETVSEVSRTGFSPP
jgi:hypothetical protein